jgi:hypothetical protein
MHVHASALDFLVFVAYSIIFGFFWRLMAARWADKPLGKAMAFVN